MIDHSSNTMKNAFDVLMASGGDAPPPDAVLSEARVCYQQNEWGETYICGLELVYSHVQLDPPKWSRYKKRCGKIVRENMSEAINFSEENDIEHIIGGEFECDGDGITSLDLYTSHYGGRVVSFYVSSDRVDTTGDSVGEYHGCYESTKEGKKLSPHSSKRGME